DRDDGTYQAQMAVYVKPRGRLGRAYMAFIKPFRYWIVYPALERELGSAWSRRRAAQGLGGTLHRRKRDAFSRSSTPLQTTPMHSKSLSANMIRALPNKHSVTDWVPSRVYPDVWCYGSTAMCCGSGSAPSAPPTT